MVIFAHKFIKLLQKKSILIARKVVLIVFLELFKEGGREGLGITAAPPAVIPEGGATQT